MLTIRADKVFERIKGLRQTTCIVISHDFGIASQADRILVLNEGKVADIGTHVELLDRCPIYKNAYERQQRRLAL